ncbi:MAG: hypothetical protein ACRDRI_19145 [Pseudonocardiaceae bacterium]
MSTSARELTNSTSAGTTQPADPPTAKAAGEIRQAIAHTREQLSDAVETLVHEIDLPARVIDKAHQGKETVQAKVDEVRQHLHKGTETVQDKAEEATLRAKGLTRQAWAKLSAPMTKRIDDMRETVRQRPVPIAAVALGVLGVSVFLRRLRRRNR